MKESEAYDHLGNFGIGHLNRGFFRYSFGSSDCRNRQMKSPRRHTREPKSLLAESWKSTESG
ncbi:hypothetical protein IAG15_25255, partial [Enterococcus faecalis]|nr:hypothetical protein [Enterococcus faecalis]